MSDLVLLRGRARRAAERGRARAALRAGPALAAFVLVLVAVAPAPHITGPIALGVAASALALRWWRRALGWSATEGVLMGAPAALAGGVARACMADGPDWSCGVACVVIGIGAALVSGLASTQDERPATSRALTAAFGAMTAFAGCAGLGAGAALAAAVATGGTWAGVAAARARSRAS